MIQHTAERLAQAGYQIDTAEMALEELDLPEGSFDVVVCTGVLHQVCSVADYHALLCALAQF